MDPEYNLDYLKDDINVFLWTKLHSLTSMAEAEKVACTIYDIVRKSIIDQEKKYQDAIHS